MKRNILVLLAAAGLGLCLPGASFAQWVHVGGPGGCTINSLGVVGTNLLAGTFDGVFQFSDKGTSWTAVNWKAAERGVPTWTHCLARSGADIFAGTWRGLLRSKDGGVSWSKLTVGLPKEPNVRCLAIVGTKIFAGLGGGNEDQGPGGLFLSTDNGDSWKRVHAGLPEQLWVECFAISGEEFFAGTYHGVFLSADNGESWTAVNTGLPEAHGVRCLAVKGRYLFAGFWSGRIFRSADNGKSWEAANSGLPPVVISGMAVIGPNIFVGTWGFGVFQSADNGKSWRATNSGLPGNVQVVSLAEVGANIFAEVSCNWGPVGKALYRSGDGGLTWTAVSPGLSEVNCFEVSGTALFAGTYRGLYRSDDNGVTWRAFNTGLPEEAVIKFLAASGPRLFTATDEGVVYSSLDNGASWSASRSGWPEKAKVLCLLTNGPNLYAGIHLPPVFDVIDGVERASQQDAGLGIYYLATDKDRTWREVNSGLPTSPRLSSLAASGLDLYAGLLRPAVWESKAYEKPAVGLGIFCSVNGGKTWAAANSGLPKNTIVNCLAISGPNVIAGTAGKGVFLSRDKGKSWTALNAGLPPESNVLCCATSNKSLYISINDHGIWRLSLSGLKPKEP